MLLSSDKSLIKDCFQTLKTNSLLKQKTAWIFQEKRTPLRVFSYCEWNEIFRFTTPQKLRLCSEFVQFPVWSDLLPAPNNKSSDFFRAAGSVPICPSHSKQERLQVKKVEWSSISFYMFNAKCSCWFCFPSLRPWYTRHWHDQNCLFVAKKSTFDGFWRLDANNTRSVVFSQGSNNFVSQKSTRYDFYPHLIPRIELTLTLGLTERPWLAKLTGAGRLQLN